MMFKAEKKKLSERRKSTVVVDLKDKNFDVKILSALDFSLNKATVSGSTLETYSQYFEQVEKNQTQVARPKEKIVYFVSPQLPHPCEIEIWNATVKRMGSRGVVITSTASQKNFDHFAEFCKVTSTFLALSCRTLDTVAENKTFLCGLEAELEGASLVVAVGEGSLASYQAVKIRRLLQNRLVIWQTAPRPPQNILNLRGDNSMSSNILPQVARERTIRREVLKNCDALLCFDKDSANWAFLEDVSPQRIRRVSRAINIKRFSKEMNALQRISIRSDLGLPEADFIFLQAGPLEIETGALDTVYAFKNLIQSDPALLNKTKLAFCGTGSAGAEVRQAVVDLQLDSHVVFLNPNDSNTRQIIGNQLSNLLAVCDAVIHNPLCPVNGSPSKNLDCSYDILCALASGITVISNGNGWCGEWVARFYRTFGSGSIHGLSKLMKDSIEKQEKVLGIKKAIRGAVENELDMSLSVSELSDIFENLLSSRPKNEDEDLSRLLEQIEKTTQAKQYLDAIQYISTAFQLPGLGSSQKAHLFRHVGDCFTKLGDIENGRQNYLRALELDPFCGRSLIGLGTVALQEHNYNVAVPQFQKAVALLPSDDMASLGLGLAFEGLGELNEAMHWTVRACNLNIENTVSLFNLVKLAYDLESFVVAEDIVARYVALHPNDINMTFTLGGLCFKLGKIEAATTLMEAILISDPMNSRAHGLLSQINKEIRLKKHA